jgi:nucleoside 2-deoxyribosyltransferase
MPIKYYRAEIGKAQLTVYLAGPMRGYPKFNFPAFDEAENRLARLGFNVISPASMDRELGFNENTDPFTQNDLENCVRRDLDAVIKCDMVVYLDGSENSVGATAEMAVAKWLGKPIKPYSQYADL